MPGCIECGVPGYDGGLCAACAEYACSTKLTREPITRPFTWKLTHRQRDAALVRDALEAAARAEPDNAIASHLYTIASRADTETLAYIRRLLK